MQSGGPLAFVSIIKSVLNLELLLDSSILWSPLLLITFVFLAYFYEDAINLIVPHQTLYYSLYLMKQQRLISWNPIM